MITTSKDTTKFADSLVVAYNQWDRFSESFEVRFDDLADFDKEKLCALIMRDNPDMAYEAMGSDNPEYHSMIAALTLFMEDSFDKDRKDNFLSHWQKGLVSYFRKAMEKVLDDSVVQYNIERAA